MFIIKDKAAWDVGPVQEDGSFIVSSKTEGSHVAFTVFSNGKTDKLNAEEDDIFKDELVVRFDDREFTPAAFRCRPERKSNAILAAINFDVPDGFKVVNIVNDGVQILGNFVTPTHVEFIGNFGVPPRKGKNDAAKRDSSSIMFVTLNDKARKVETYRYRYGIKDKTILMECRRSNLTDIPAKGKPGYIRTNDFVGRCLENGNSPLQNFYPSSPTHLILCHPMDVEDLTQTINDRKYWRAPRDYNIIQEYDLNTMRKLAEDGFVATCVYVPVILSKEMKRDQGGNKLLQDALSNQPIFEALKNAKEAGFKFIFIIGINGFISRWFIEGREQFSLGI